MKGATRFEIWTIRAILRSAKKRIAEIAEVREGMADYELTHLYTISAPLRFKCTNPA